MSDYELAYKIMYNLYSIYCREHGMRLESLTLTPKNKEGKEDENGEAC